jgi:hypothetical protein
MEEQSTNIEKLTDNVKEYLQTRQELIFLKVTEKVSNIGSYALSGLVIGVLTLMFVLFISIAGAMYFSSRLGNPYSGFFIVAGIYLLLLVIVAVFKKKMIVKPVRNKIIKEIFDDK